MVLSINLIDRMFPDIFQIIQWCLYNLICLMSFFSRKKKDSQKSDKFSSKLSFIKEIVQCCQMHSESSLNQESIVSQWRFWKRFPITRELHIQQSWFDFIPPLQPVLKRNWSDWQKSENSEVHKLLNLSTSADSAIYLHGWNQGIRIEFQQ